MTARRRPTVRSDTARRAATASPAFDWTIQTVTDPELGMTGVLEGANEDG
jgi:hypothetical protein